MTSALAIGGDVRIGHGTTLDLTSGRAASGGRHTVVRAHRVLGRFGSVRVNGRPVRADYGRSSITVRL